MEGLREAWMADVEDSEATQAFLNAAQNYPVLARQQTNLFKCFLPQAWMIGSEQRCGGLSCIRRGIYDDPKGGTFFGGRCIRACVRTFSSSERTRSCFPNRSPSYRSSALTSTERMLPPNQSSTTSPISTPRRRLMSRSPTMASGAMPGLKDDEGTWNTNGHRSRVLQVKEADLATFCVTVRQQRYATDTKRGYRRCTRRSCLPPSRKLAAHIAAASLT